MGLGYQTEGNQLAPAPIWEKREVKILTVIGIVGAVILTYILITAFWSDLMIPAIQVAENATDNTSYPETYYAIKTAPIWLYITPAVVGLVAIVWKLRQKG
jgi:hypothetical protein